MARRDKKSAGKASVNLQGPDQRRRNVEKLIQSGKVKDAFKEAKLYFHQDPSPENHLLVERTYLLRIQSLIGGGMASAGREVAQSMLEFGVRDPATRKELALLLPHVGLADQAMAIQEELQLPELKAVMAAKMADQAVLHPEQTPASMTELKDAADAVRQALAALDSNKETQALELLQPIPRSSPMADWRLFIRGLIAYRRDELEQMKANWDRLDPHRAAARIAQVLLSLSNPAGAGQEHKRLRALESAVFHESVLGPISDLRSAIENSDWKRVLAIIGPLKKSLERIHPRYALRLTECVLSPLAEEIKRQDFDAARRLIDGARTVLEPLPWDPRWNRFTAILWEGSQGDPRIAIDNWRKYLKDVTEGAAAGLGEAHRVQALVWRRIGELYIDIAGETESEEFEEVHPDVETVVDKLLAQAVDAWKQSIRLDPTQRKSHQRLIDLYDGEDQPELMATALNDLLEAFPDDVDSLHRLIRLYIELERPEPLLECVARLRSLRPLDPQAGGNEIMGRNMLARQLAARNRCDEARAEMARAEALLKDEAADPRQLSRRAALEFKAGDYPRAEACIDRAREKLNEPAVLWLALGIEAARYELDEALRDRFGWELQSALGRKVVSETAGELAELMASFFGSGMNYPGLHDHLKAVVGYLRRTKRLKYREQDLRHVCVLLRESGADDGLLQSLVKRGLKLHPRSPIFPVLEAETQLKGPPHPQMIVQIQKKLEKSLVLAEASQDPLHSEWIPRIREMLGRVRDACEALGALPFFPGGMGMPRSPREMMDMFEEMFSDVEGDSEDGEFDDEPPPTRGPKRPPKRKPR